MTVLRFVLAAAFAVAAAEVTRVIADPLDAAAGKALFDRIWIPAPSSTDRCGFTLVVADHDKGTAPKP